MKTILSLLLITILALVFPRAQSGEYWAETTDLDSFEVIEKGKRRFIEPYRSDGTKFVFSSEEPGRTHIRMFCEPCEEKLTLKLYGAEEDAYTDWIQLGDGQKISLADCFAKYPAKTGLSALFATGAEMLSDFWDSLGNGRFRRDRGPVMKGVHPEPEDPKLEYLKTDAHYYLAPERFFIRFHILGNYPVKSIHIISHDGQLLFHGGDREILGEVFDLSGTTSPPISSILKTGQSKESEMTFELNWEQIKSHLFHKFEPGSAYQLGVQLEGDPSEFNPYLFNFQFFSPEEVETMKQFFERD